MLAEHPHIAESAAFAIPDARWGELPAAAVVAADGAGIDADEVADFAAARLARHKRPRRVEVLDALPRSPAGKVLRTVLQERFAGD